MQNASQQPFEQLLAQDAEDDHEEPREYEGVEHVLCAREQSVDLPLHSWMTEDSEDGVLGAASTLQIQSEALVVACYGLTETAVLTVQACRARG